MEVYAEFGQHLAEQVERHLIGESVHLFLPLLLELVFHIEQQWLHRLSCAILRRYQIGWAVEGGRLVYCMNSLGHVGVSRRQRVRSSGDFELVILRERRHWHAQRLRVLGTTLQLYLLLLLQRCLVG